MRNEWNFRLLGAGDDGRIAALMKGGRYIAAVGDRGIHPSRRARLFPTSTPRLYASNVQAVRSLRPITFRLVPIAEALDDNTMLSGSKAY